MAKIRKLTAELQIYVVQRLACFDSPSDIASALRKEAGVDVRPQTIEGYDPSKKAGAKVAERWRILFEDTRKTFLADIAGIGIANKAVRLRRLDQMEADARRRGNTALAAQLLEQAAKEEGGAFTNRRELTGKDGKDLPAPANPVTIFQLPDNGRGDGPGS